MMINIAFISRQVKTKTKMLVPIKVTHMHTSVTYMKRKHHLEFSVNQPSQSYRPTLLFWACLLTYTLMGCGGQKIDYGAKACEHTVEQLSRRVGPEFKAVHQALSIPVKIPTLYGCAVVFSRVQEELPGEVSGSYNGSLSSHELAIGLPDLERRLVLTMISSPPYRKTAVKLDARLQEFYGGGELELLILESAMRRTERYQAVSVYSFAEGVPSPRELFSSQLLIKTPEGITVIPRWGRETYEGRDIVLFQGGGEYKVFMWHEGTQRFKLDLAASQRRKLNPSRVPQKTRKTPSLKTSPKTDGNSSPLPSNQQPSKNTRDDRTSVKDLLKTL